MFPRSSTKRRTTVASRISLNWRHSRQELSGKPGAVQSRVLGQFPSESEYGLINREWLEAAAERFESGVFADEAAAAIPMIAVDPARYGPDLTACAVRRGPVLTEIITWAKLDTMETADRVAIEAERVGIHPGVMTMGLEGRTAWVMRPRGKIIVDEVGVGAGTMDALKKARWVTPERELKWRVVGFSGGRKASRKFFNERAAAFWRLHELLEQGKIAMAWDEKLADELMDIRWSLSGEQRIQIEGKDQLKSRLGRSPDRADAVSMVFGAPSMRIGVHYGAWC